MTMLILAMTALVCAAIPAVIFFRNSRAYRPAPVGLWRYGQEPAVSVLIPARNEERSVGAAVASVLANRGARIEVIVMDDHSEDRTAAMVEEIARQHPEGMVRLLRAPPLPDGWNGKQHACARLAEAASHDWLVFMDADVRLSPDALTRMVAFMEHNWADLGSGIPHQVTVSFWEKLVIPQIHFLLLGFLPIRRMRKRSHPSYGAGCGQLFIARRDAYEATGGHGAIGASRHDGIKLPRLFRSLGFRTDLFDATDIASCRMYRNGGDVWRGFLKNATEGLAAPKVIAPFTALLVFGQLLPFWLVWRECDARMLSLLAVALAYYPRWMAAMLYRQSWLGALLHPVGVLVVLAIQWTALVRHVAGWTTNWKGRPETVAEPVRSPLRQKQNVAVLIALPILTGMGTQAEERAPATPARMAAFELSDQHDRPSVVRFPREQAMVLTVADHAGSKQLEDWISHLKNAFADRLEFVGVADVSAAPAAMRGMIKQKFKKQMAHPVFLDWTGRVARLVSSQPGHANVYLVGRDGTILCHETGLATPEKVARLTHVAHEVILSTIKIYVLDRDKSVVAIPTRNQPTNPASEKEKPQ